MMEEEMFITDIILYIKNIFLHFSSDDLMNSCEIPLMYVCFNEMSLPNISQEHK